MAMRGHVDLRGQPIMDHIERVYRRTDNRPDRPMTALHVAYLHDLLEDTGFTRNDLLRIGYSPEIVHSVGLLTHNKKQHPWYAQYINRLLRSGDRDALIVKLSDVSDNNDPARFVGLPDDKVEFLKARYAGLEDRLRDALCHL